MINNTYYLYYLLLYIINLIRILVDLINICWNSFNLKRFNFNLKKRQNPSRKKIEKLNLNFSKNWYKFN